MDDLSSLLDPSLDAATQQQKAAAMAAALRGQQQYGNLLQAGSPMLADVGRAQSQAAGNQLGQISQEIEKTPGMALTRGKVAEEQARLAAESSPEAQKLLANTLGQIGLKGDFSNTPALTLSHVLDKTAGPLAAAASRRDVAKTNAQARADAAEATRQAVADRAADRQSLAEERLANNKTQFDEREVQQLSKPDQKGTAALAAKDAAIRLIDRIHQPGGENVPGVGRFQSMVPTMLSPQTWQDNQADAVELAKSVLLAKGGAITPEAIHLQMKALGLSKGSSVETFKHGIAMGLDEIASKLQQREAGFRPSNVAEYKNRGGVLSSDLKALKDSLVGGGQQQSPVTVTSQEQYDALPAGTHVVDTSGGHAIKGGKR